MLEPIYTTNILDYFNEYTEGLDPLKISNLRTALYRYYGAGLSGHKTKKVRLDQRGLDKAERYLKKVSIDEDFDIESHIQIFDKGTEVLGVPANKVRAAKSYLRSFLEYINSKFNKPVVIKEKTQAPLLTRKVVDKSYIPRNGKPDRVKQKVTIAIDSKAISFIERLQQKYSLKSQAELEEIIKTNLERLNKEFEKYTDFWKDEKLRQVTIDQNILSIKRILGWSYLHDDSVTIEDITLEYLIPVINCKVYNVKSREDKFIREGELQELAKLQSQSLLKKIDMFLKSYKVKKASSAGIYIGALINLAKYLYRDITEIDEATNYEDISVIRFLRVKRIKLSQTGEPTKKTPLFLTWEEVLEVVESFRLDFLNDNINRSTNNKDKKRIAGHLRRFLLLAMFTIIPPDRQRTIRELTYGKTLVYGKRDNTGTIMNLDPKLDINNEGSYFITLKSEDYKTGDAYGDFIIAIPNKKYSDETTFYSYLNKWLFEGYRDLLANESAETVFVGTKSGLPMDASALGRVIALLFKHRTGIHLSPHKLRNIFVTHINNQGLTDQQRKSMAYAMKHDISTADKVYNSQTSEERLKLAIEYFND